jgi:hypothetical protein
MDKIISYTDDIKKYLSGTEYSGKNIKTTDGKVGYVTKTGLLKQYNSANSLSNRNGCTTNLQQIGSSWGDLGMPVGTLMVDGQSCGNETKYVQSMPSNPNFDWQYYIKSNPNLQLTTEQQAYEHWTSKGIYEGLLPNSSFLSNMSNVGKLGYIDINTTLRPVQKDNYQYTGEYKLFNSNNVTGASMQDCIVPPPLIKYGHQIYIKYENRYASVNQQSIFEIGATKNMVFISSTDYSLYNTPLKYGDTFIIVAPSKAAYVNSSTSMLSLGPIGDTIQTFMVFPPTGSSFEYRAKIRYGDPVVLVSISKVNWSEQVGIDYPSDDIGHSIKPLAECQAACVDNPRCVGFVTDKVGRNNCWLKSRFASATPQSNLSSYMLDSAANTSVNTTKISWQQTPGKDYWGNDINNSIKPLDECKASCQATSGCVGIVTDSSGKNNCWLKNKFANEKNNSNRQSYMMNISTVNLPPFKKSVMDKYSVGYVNNNNMMFGPEKDSIGKNIFTIESATNPPYVAQCDLNDLKNQCTRDAKCNGIIHSEKDNTWQMMNDKAMYKITPVPPNIYVKDIAVNGNNTTFIDSNTFANYPVNNNFVKEGSQEYNVNNKNLLKKKQEYNQGNNMAFNEGDKMLNTAPKISPYINETNHMYNQLNSKTNEYENVLKTIKKEKKKFNGTLNQQKEDLTVLQESNQNTAYLWGLSCIVVISMVVILKNKQ